MGREIFIGIAVQYNTGITAHGITSPSRALQGILRLAAARHLKQKMVFEICMGSFSAEVSAGKTHAVGDFGRESFQGVGSGGPIPPVADWKNKTEEDYDR